MLVLWLYGSSMFPTSLLSYLAVTFGVIVIHGGTLFKRVVSFVIIILRGILYVYLVPIPYLSRMV